MVGDGRNDGVQGERLSALIDGELEAAEAASTCAGI